MTKSIQLIIFLKIMWSLDTFVKSLIISTLLMFFQNLIYTKTRPYPNLVEKLAKFQEQLVHSLSTIRKLIFGILKLYNILNSIKSSLDKKGLGFEEGLTIIIIGYAPKFIKPAIQDPKLKFVTTTPKGKSFVMSLSFLLIR